MCMRKANCHPEGAQRPKDLGKVSRSFAEFTLSKSRSFATLRMTSEVLRMTSEALRMTSSTKLASQGPHDVSLHRTVRRLALASPRIERADSRVVGRNQAHCGARDQDGSSVAPARVLRSRVRAICRIRGHPRS